MKEHLITINTDACIGCQLCKKDCPANNITVANQKATIKGQNCVKCGHCVAICPKEAVSMSGFEQKPIPLDAQTLLDPKLLLAALSSRRSIRQFRDTPVPQKIISQIIEAGRLTPTARNAQNTSYLVLQNEKTKAEALAVRFFKKLLPLARFLYPAIGDIIIDDNFFFKKAPTALVVFSPDSISASLAASNMALMAEACGLGVLYSGFFTIAANHSRSLRKQLDLKRGQKAVTTLVLGYSSVTYPRSAQKEVAQVSIK